MLTFRSNRHEPLHLQASERIRQLIRRRHLQPGDALPTIQELCKYLGLSYVTVHKALAVLARKGLVQPIRGKGTFVSGRGDAEHGHSQIGLVSAGSYEAMLTVPYSLDTFRGVVGAASAANADVRIFSLRVPGERLSRGELTQMDVDGLLVVELTDPAMMRQFANAGVPVVVADACTPEVPLDYVVCDNEGGAAHAVRHLIGLGHRRIHYVGGYAVHPVTRAYVESWDAQSRCRGYRDAMAQAGLTPVCHAWAESDLQSKDATRWYSLVARQITAGRNGPTAVVTYDCRVAQILAYRLAEASVEVPRDLSVAAVAGATSESLLSRQPLAYCAFDFLSMGSEATRILLSRYQQPPSPLEQTHIHRIGFTFVPGATCAAPR